MNRAVTVAKNKPILPVRMIAALAVAISALLLAVPAGAERPERDLQLYQSVARQVGEGRSYYDAAVETQRDADYPVRPFYTVRPPTLSLLAARLGPQGLVFLAWLLVAIAAMEWIRAIADRTARFAFALLLALYSGAIISSTTVFFGELWCGLLTAIALGSRDWRVRLTMVFAACLFREFGFLLLLAILAEAMLRKRWYEVAVGAVLAGTTVLLFALHAHQVLLRTFPGDAQSQGWFAVRGLSGLLTDLARLTPFAALPLWVTGAALALALIGWARRSFLTILWFSGFCLTIMVASRPDNFYWVLVMMPLLPAGLAFAIPPRSGAVAAIP